jgi:hypothetical protein
MFRTDLLSIIRSPNTVYTAINICHASYVDCLLARSGWNSSSVLTSLCTVLRLLMMDIDLSETSRFLYQNKLRNTVSRWFLLQEVSFVHQARFS